MVPFTAAVTRIGEKEKLRGSVMRARIGAGLSFEFLSCTSASASVGTTFCADFVRQLFYFLYGLFSFHLFFFFLALAKAPPFPFLRHAEVKSWGGRKGHGFFPTTQICICRGPGLMFVKIASWRFDFKFPGEKA